MSINEHELLEKARGGDVRAFHELFADHHRPLKAYLYRLLTDRNDADDFAHDTFVRAFERVGTFAGNSSFKTWLFAIATNLALDALRRRRRWRPDSQDRSRALAESDPDIEAALVYAHQHSPLGAYDIREHIEFCFTCMAKTLPIDEQVALILKDVYAFRVFEIAIIMERTEGAVKHLLHRSRRTMTEIFEDRCALVSKTGACHQCSELNDYFNPGRSTEQHLVQIEMVRQATTATQPELYELRARLVRSIDPLTAGGSDLHEVFMKLTHEAEGEPGISS